MKWSDAYSTGNEAIDKQHRMIFRMTEDFRASLDEGRGERVYGELLRSLDLYVRTHFRFEEKCMAECHCPVAATNRDAHAVFVKVLSEYKQRYAAVGYDRKDAGNLVETLDRWLIDHIGRIDVRLRDFTVKQ